MGERAIQDPAQRARHQATALLARGRCPHCAELVAAAQFFRADDCPRCEGTLGSFGHTADSVVEVLTTRGRRQLAGVCAIIAVAHLTLGWVPLLEALTLVAAALWLRWGIILPATRAMSPARRIVATWTARLLVGALLGVTLVFTQLSMLLGPLTLPIKAALGVAQVAGSAALLTAYLHRQLRREAAGRPVGAGEWVVLAVITGALVGAVAALGLAFFFVLSALEWVLAGLGGGA